MPQHAPTQQNADPRQFHAIAADQDVEVLWEGEWRFGLLKEWRRYEDGTWAGWCRFHIQPGENRIGVFKAEAIRPA